MKNENQIQADNDSDLKASPLKIKKNINKLTQMEEDELLGGLYIDADQNSIKYFSGELKWDQYGNLLDECK